MKIKITQLHLRKGDKANPSSCALALAILKATGERVVVSGTEISFRGASRYRVVPLPFEAKQFVTRFDNGVAQPCVLEIPGLTPPEEKL